MSKREFARAEADRDGLPTQAPPIGWASSARRGVAALAAPYEALGGGCDAVEP